MSKYSFIVSDIKPDTKIRLDKFLSNQLEISRNQLENLIRKLGVLVNNNKIHKCGFSLNNGDEIKIEIIQTQNKVLTTKVDFDVPIIYEDDDILIIDKPNGITTHRAVSEKNPTIVDWLESKKLSLSNIAGEDRNGIVHRLDKPTSGIMVIAKNNESHANLSQQLRDRSMGRYYIALINPFLKDDITIEKDIGRSKNNRLKMTTHNMTTPRYAKTTFKKLIPSNDSFSELVVAKLHTGRTHQIRAHLQSIQRSILGDSTYGYTPKWGLPNMIFLQAKILYLKHPRNNEQIVFSSDLNKQMNEFCQKHFEMEKVNEKLDTNYLISLFNNI